MNLIKPKQLFKTIYRLVGVVSISSAICLPTVARPYYYPPSSFFSPTANYFQSEDDPNVVQMLDELGDYQTLTHNLKQTELTKKLSQEKSVTILAPTDQAFEALSSEIKEKLSDPETLEKVLKYHIFLGSINEEDIQRREIVALDGESIKISGESVDGKVIPLFNQAKASDPYFPRNGVIIPIDSVLIPPSLLDQ